MSVLWSEDSNCKGGDAGNTDAGGDAGNGGDGICGNGDDSKVSGDGGGVVKVESLSTSLALSKRRVICVLCTPVVSSSHFTKYDCQGPDSSSEARWETITSP
ncbi:hypothetical protein Tco_0776079 [Tanacetum coccineum]